MIKKYFKKLVSVALSAVMVMGMSVTAFASETDNTSVRGVYSPEFPDAYIITETNSEPVGYSIDSTEIQPATVTATVFVEESYAVDRNGEVYVSDSRLLSKEEVDDIGIDNFDNLNTLATPRAAKNSYGKLTLTFSGTHSKSGKSVSCKLTADADWDFVKRESFLPMASFLTRPR